LLRGGGRILRIGGCIVSGVAWTARVGGDRLLVLAPEWSHFEIDFFFEKALRIKGALRE
jgi:hypothetical protein